VQRPGTCERDLIAGNFPGVRPTKNALSAGPANRAFPVERTGIEPVTSGLQSQESKVVSGNLSEVAMTDSAGCISGPKKAQRGRSNSTLATPESLPAGDFAAALAMIATLPLSDAEKAEDVGRLMDSKQ